MVEKESIEEEKYEPTKEEFFEDFRLPTMSALRESSYEGFKRSTTERVLEYDNFLKHQKKMTK